ncbi:MAG: hypothetical protein WBE26_12570 [Phycisphaerae bacterium]
MQAVRQGGVSGKARRVRYRNRAARLYTQQMIDDYIELDPDGLHRERHIPIRGRKEFLPSIAQRWDASVDRHDAQLELPLGLPEKMQKVQRAADKTRTVPQASPKPEADAVIRFPRIPRRETDLELKPPVQYRRKAGFTFSGFLIGCAMGSAAAAMVLLVVQTVFG